MIFYVHISQIGVRITHIDPDRALCYLNDDACSFKILYVQMALTYTNRPVIYPLRIRIFFCDVHTMTFGSFIFARFRTSLFELTYLQCRKTCDEIGNKCHAPWPISVWF